MRNVTQTYQVNYAGLGGTRTTNYTYLNTSGYTSRYIFNRLTGASVTDGTTPQTLTTVTYDGYTLSGSASPRGVGHRLRQHHLPRESPPASRTLPGSRASHST